MSWNPHPNQGFHLGKLKTSQAPGRHATAPGAPGDVAEDAPDDGTPAGGGARAPSSARPSDWVWQASPWGDWNVTDGPDVILGDKPLLITDEHSVAGYRVAKLCAGYNVSLKVITPETLDGRFGDNSTGIQYGGNLAVSVGEDVVYVPLLPLQATAFSPLRWGYRTPVPWDHDRVAPCLCSDCSCPHSSCPHSLGSGDFVAVFLSMSWSLGALDHSRRKSRGRTRSTEYDLAHCPPHPPPRSS